MAHRHDLQYSIRQILQHSHEGSHGSRADRMDILMKFASDIIDLGYKLRHVNGLKTKHITGVFTQWINEDIANGTLKNRASAIRFLARKIGKPNIVASNTALGIGPRQYKPTFNRAIFNPDVSAITDKHVFLSLQLQRVFGLRREESLKIRTHQADEGNVLVLQPSWCKGKRGRYVKFCNEEQRYWLEQAKSFVRPGDSMIPRERSYAKHVKVYEYQTQKIGLNNPHGLRHAYAQTLYKKLTGWNAPINGGPSAKELTPGQREKDYEARMIITESLGHGRLEIVKNYIG